MAWQVACGSHSYHRGAFSEFESGVQERRDVCKRGEMPKKHPGEDAETGGGGAGSSRGGVDGERVAFVDNVRTDETDAVKLLVAEWSKHGVLGQGTKAVRELINQFNAVKAAVAWTPAASKVSATKQAGDVAQNQMTMAWRLARQLLCLNRADMTNRDSEVYESSLGDEAIWTKRVCMKMLLRVRNLPEDRGEVDGAMEAGGNWFVVYPSALGTKDKFGGAQEGGHDELSQGSSGQNKKDKETPK